MTEPEPTWSTLLQSLQQQSLDPAISEEKRATIQARVRAIHAMQSAQLQAIESYLDCEQQNAMLGSREGTRQMLTHPDPDVRYAAMLLLLGFWGPHSSEFQLYLTHALRDTDTEVRDCALCCLAPCCNSGVDERVGFLLANLVLNDGEPERLRQLAYCCLFALRGFSWHECPANQRSFEFPKDVDWGFVRTF